MIECKHHKASPSMLLPLLWSWSIDGLARILTITLYCCFIQLIYNTCAWSWIQCQRFSQFAKYSLQFLHRIDKNLFVLFHPFSSFFYMCWKCSFSWAALTIIFSYHLALFWCCFLLAENAHICKAGWLGRLQVARRGRAPQFLHCLDKMFLVLLCPFWSFLFLTEKCFYLLSA